MIGAWLLIVSCFVAAILVTLLVFANLDMRQWLKAHREYIAERDGRWELHIKRTEEEHREILQCVRCKGHEPDEPGPEGESTIRKDRPS